MVYANTVFLAAKATFKKKTKKFVYLHESLTHTQTQRDFAKKIRNPHRQYSVNHEIAFKMLNNGRRKCVQQPKYAKLVTFPHTGF